MLPSAAMGGEQMRDGGPALGPFRRRRTDTITEPVLVLREGAVVPLRVEKLAVYPPRDER
jgi:hypothetical protein